jgi:hypothetical protein
MKYFNQWIEVRPNFEYYQLDYLNNVKPDEILNSTDHDDLYSIWINSSITNLAQFYLYVVDNYPQSILLLELKMSALYTNENNPFNNINYTLDSWVYLFNHDFIQMIPERKIKKGSMKTIISKNKIPTFVNRIRYYLNN